MHVEHGSKSLFSSEILTPNGKFVLPEALHRKRLTMIQPYGNIQSSHMEIFKIGIWLANHPRPSSTAWRPWKKLLQHLCTSEENPWSNEPVGPWKDNHSTDQRWYWYHDNQSIYNKISTTIKEKEIIKDNRTTLVGSPYIIDRETLPPQAIPTIPTSPTKWKIPRVLKNPSSTRPLSSPPITSQDQTFINYVHNEYPGLKEIINAITILNIPTKQKQIFISSNGGRKYDNLSYGGVCTTRK